MLSTTSRTYPRTTRLPDAGTPVFFRPLFLFSVLLACLSVTGCANSAPSGIWLGSPWFGIHYTPSRSAPAERVVIQRLPAANGTVPAANGPAGNPPEAGL